jgi:hypothetical protein
VKNECHQTFTSDVIGHAFEIEASHFRKICPKADKKPKHPDRPQVLDEVKPLVCLLSFKMDMALTIT